MTFRLDGKSATERHGNTELFSSTLANFVQTRIDNFTIDLEEQVC